MTLEQFTAELNASTFWREFTFSQTKFSPRPKQQVELADGIVRIGPLAYVLQLKERTEGTDDPEVERQWFNSKVLRKATKQIRDSVGYLSEHDTIRLTNERGHAIDVRGAELADINKIVIYQGGEALPPECRATQFHVSQTVGFIHILDARDYLGILDYLRVPEDIRRYFEYREAALRSLHEGKVSVEEPDIMVGFLSDLELPVAGSKEILSDFVQDIEDFDLTYTMSSLLEHIQNPDESRDYYRILIEFARVPRAAWRAFKERLMKSLDACRAGEFCQPYRFTFPATGSTFMIGSLDPKAPVIGPEGERLRGRGLEALTRGAKYDAKSAIGVGLLVSKDGKDIYLDWCLVDEPWEHDAWLEHMLATANPFRPVSEKKMDSFFFRISGAVTK